jgi:hypothetical protein
MIKTSIRTITTGTILFMMISGLITPEAAIPTDDLPVPYAAPKPDCKKKERLY